MPLQINQSAPEVRIGSLERESLGIVQPLADLRVEVRLVLVVVGKRAVDLR